MDTLGETIVLIKPDYGFRFGYTTFVSREAEAKKLLSISEKKIIKASNEIWEPIIEKTGFLFSLHDTIEMSDFPFTK